MDTEVWFVTGCSKGMDRYLVSELLNQNYRVCATSRNKDKLIEIFGKESDMFLPLSVELQNEDSVKDAINESVEKFGRIDCVVNNAGYTHLATMEEMTDREVRDIFDINIFECLT